MRPLRRTAAVALAVAVLAGGVVLAVATPSPSHAAGRTGTSVYFVHGYGYSGCVGRWDRVLAAFREWGWKGPLHTVGYYGDIGDAACTDRIARGSTDTSIAVLGRALARYLYAQRGRHPVDLVGHSMGGLIIRAALDGVARHRPGFPPALRVANAVTVSTPHHGVRQSAAWRRCANTECRQMRPGSAFLRGLWHAPQGTGGTDWSELGATPDRTVSWRSALEAAARHRYHYLGGQPSGLDATLTHGGIKVAAAHNHGYRLRYRNSGMRAFRYTARGRSPLYAVFAACALPTA